LTAEEISGLLEMMTCDDSTAQRHALREVCPCRNRCEDQEVWLAVCHAYNTPGADQHVQDTAFHALETLVERARTDATWQEMRDWLVAQGALWVPLEKPGARTRQSREERKLATRITAKDVPRLLDDLACGDPETKEHALGLVCPCRNRNYDKQLWLAIFRAYEGGETGEVRDKAGHAIGTLLERARIDPRSQKLLRELAAEGVDSLPLDTAVPVWIPNLRGNGLYIPRFERTPRSKANRRR
jgi:hypothetical protein